MVSRVRGRLTYANVVATLALFVALGGTSYAVSRITGKQIKDRSITRVDLRRDTLTGGEINESKLKQVPNALNAIQAASASAADVAKNANAANTAAVANVATDARALAGQGAAFFEKSSRTSFARAPANPAGTSGEQVLLSWPEMGVELTSASGAACAADHIRLGLRNTKPSGPTALLFEGATAATVTTAPAGIVSRQCMTTGTNGQVTDSTGRTLFFECRDVAGEMRCLGVRSEP
jgi:hypothetical protein